MPLVPCGRGGGGKSILKPVEVLCSPITHAAISIHVETLEEKKKYTTSTSLTPPPFFVKEE